jgi:signal transduction histidine kinase
MKFNSIRFEISILHTAILGLILFVFSGILYFISSSFFQQVDDQLKAKAQAVELALQSYVNVLDVDDPDAILKAARKTIAMKDEWVFSGRMKKVSEVWLKKSQELSLSKDYIVFFSKDRRVFVNSPNIKADLVARFIEDIHLTPGMDIAFKTISYHRKNIRIITSRVDGKFEDDYYVQVGVSQDPIIQILRNWIFSLAISFPFILLLTGFLGRRQAARILDPVNEITQMAHKITHQDLSARIKAKHFDSEMETLIESFNDMIARLEKSFKHIEEFSHHVAHELKTPLTIIKGEADLLLRKERSKQEYQQALRIILEESERVLRTIEDLLLLSKLDYQLEVFKFDVFDFMEFLNETCEQSRMVAAQKSVAITLRTQGIKSSLMIKGDSLHLRRLFFNVIDNAIKFTPAGGGVEITVMSNQVNKVVVTIKDSGPGIAPENLMKIFDKFYSADAAGNGFGLNIAWTIAKLHKGEILAESKVGEGTIFTIILPTVS